MNLQVDKIGEVNQAGFRLDSHIIIYSVGRYHFFTSSIRYDKFKTVFGISLYLMTQNCTKKIV